MAFRSNNCFFVNNMPNINNMNYLKDATISTNPVIEESVCMSNRDIGNWSPVSSSGVSNSDSQCGSTTTGGMSPDTTMMDDEIQNSGLPYLKIVEQPSEEFRFRYQSEMQGAHGNILGQNSGKNRKTFPTVKLCNFTGKALIRCSLATTGPNPSVHAHRLVAKLQGTKEKEKDDPHDIEVGPENFEAMFQNMVIIHIEKKKAAEILEKKIKTLIAHRFLHSKQVTISSEEEKKIKMHAKNDAENMDMNQVSLKFEALAQNEKQNMLVPVCKPVYSVPINNSKSHLTGKLRICRIDRFCGSCRGNDEVFIFVDKVAKQNIKVQFFEQDEDGKEIWCDDAEFTENDVHHQFGIVFRTPPYRTPDITRNVPVKVRLFRPSDRAVSDPLHFQYKPDFGSGTKKRKASSDFPVNDVCLNRVNILQSPLRSPDTTVDVQTEPNDFQIPIDIISNFGSEAFDIDLLLANDIPLLEDPMVIDNATEPSFNEVLDQLPTPVSEEFRIAITRLYSSGEDFEDYKEAVMNSSNVVVDGIRVDYSCRAGPVANVRDNPLKQSITLVEGLQMLKRILLFKKRGIIGKQKFSDIINHYFTWPLDQVKNNRIIHLAVQSTVCEKYIDFLTELQKEDFVGDESELINIQNVDQQTALHIAVAKGLSDIVTKLISSGLVDLNRKDLNNKTPLHYAVSYANINNTNSLDILRTILNHLNHEVNEMSEDGTPLHLAMRHRNNFQILDILLEHPSIDVNLCGGSTRGTIMHLAVRSLNISTVKNLMNICNKHNKELDMNIKDICGYTPLTFCNKFFNDDDLEKVDKAHEIIRYITDTSSIEEDAQVQTMEGFEIEDEEESEVEDEIEDIKPSQDSLNHLVENLVVENYRPKSELVDEMHSLMLEMPLPIASAIKTEETVVKEEEYDEKDEDDNILGYNETTGMFDKKGLKQLMAVLDNNNAWKKLALLLGYKNFIASFESQESPTLALLTYVERYSASSNLDMVVATIHDHLITSNLMDAVEVMKDMILRKRFKASVI